MATTVITGGRGFLGGQLASRLLAQPDPGFAELILADQSPEPSPVADPLVRHMVGDVANASFLRSIITPQVTRVFHLASVVSAGAEEDFDLGYAVNLAGTLALLDRCRTVGASTGVPIQVVFTSSCAAYGSGAAGGASDTTALRPETSYGVQKATCELLLNDYHRKGFIDGRALRLPTVAVRPGKPNKAASGFASGIIREPLNGTDMVCPVRAETVVAVISPRRVIDSLVLVSALEPEVLGNDRTLLLPGLAMSMAEALDAVAAEGAGRPLGLVDFQPDPSIQRIVDSWPPTIAGERATKLGFVGDTSVAAIVRQHIQDRLEK